MFQYLNDIEKKRFFNTVMLVLVLLAIFIGAEVFNTIKGYSYIGRGIVAANVISVSGTGEVVVVPDTGRFSFSVVEEGKSVGVAQDASAKKINAIIEALKKLGILEKDIKTTSYNSYPRYEYVASSLCTNGYCPPTKQVLTGYEVSQTVSVKIRKTADAGGVLTKVGDLQATNISSLDFVVDDMTAVQIQARDKAIADAKAKAQALSESLGVKFGRIVNFDEGGSRGGPVYYAESASLSLPTAKGAPTVPQVPVGEGKVTANVTITYEVN